MEFITLAQTVALILAGFATATAALLLAARFAGAGSRGRHGQPAPEVAFLFEGQRLTDASAAGRRLLEHAKRGGSDMTRLVAFLTPRFPDLHERVSACGDRETLTLTSADSLSKLRIETFAGRLRLRLDDLNDDPSALPDRLSVAALSDELATYRTIGETVPVPIWRQTTDGRIVWANAAYLSLAERLDTDAQTPHWPPRVLFDDLRHQAAPNNLPPRLQLQIPGEDAARWFDCDAAVVEDDLLFTAIPADQAVLAERSRRNFMQTLTQTFAHLSIGLAIFDRNRRLSMFNPALTDLLALPPDFLISRPSFNSFLDQLRDRRMIPEPKDYRQWCSRMSTLEAAAIDGTFTEDWAMPDGRTYRVSGRPHPDNAVAFLFEDISAEISLTRRFRAELETSQAVIDGLDEAIAVFSTAGKLTAANRSYAELWGPEDKAVPGDESFLDASRRWQQACTPTPVWGDARDFAATIGERSNWTAEVRLCDGRRLACRFETLPGGATLAGFLKIGSPAATGTRRKLTQVSA